MISRNSHSRRLWFRSGLLLVAAVIFGCAMAVREEIASLWLRAAVAAVAFGGFAAVALWLRQPRA